MAEHDQLIELLNQAVSLEYTAVIQYNQHSMLLTGQDRLLYEDLFKDSSREALSHARMWGERIVYLGGVPRTQTGAIQQSLNALEMLQMDLELEQKAVELYSRAHEVCRHEPTRYMLENHILDEDKDVEKLQKLLRRVAIAQTAAPEFRKAA